MKTSSHKELEEEFKNEMVGEWWIIYLDKLYIEMIVRKCFFYYETRPNKPTSREQWKRAINSFLEKNLKSKEFIKPPKVELNRRTKYPDAEEVISEMMTPRPVLTPEEHKAKLTWILTMMADKGNLGIRHDEVAGRVEKLMVKHLYEGEKAIVKSLIGMLKDGSEERDSRGMDQAHWTDSKESGEGSICEAGEEIPF